MTKLRVDDNERARLEAVARRVYDFIDAPRHDAAPEALTPEALTPEALSAADRAALADVLMRVDGFAPQELAQWSDIRVAGVALGAFKRDARAVQTERMRQQTARLVEETERMREETQRLHAEADAQRARRDAVTETRAADGRRAADAVRRTTEILRRGGGDE